MFSSARGQQSLSSFLDDTDETLQPTQGALRLSSFTRQLNAERERERKLARLPPEILSKYTAKKKQLEAIAVEFFAILLKYGFKELIFRHFKKIAPPWMLERMLRSKGYYGLRRDFPPSNVFRDIDNLERSLDYAKWLEFITPFLREKDSRFRLARHHPFKQRMIQLREAVLNQDWSKVGAFIGLLPAFRRNLKEVPEPFRKQLENNSARTCGILQPYAATVFRSGMERFMHHDIPNTLFDTENSSLLYVTELLIFAIANGQDQEAQDLIDATSSLPSVTLSHRYNNVFHAYRSLFRFERWRLAKEGTCGESSSLDLAEEFTAAMLLLEALLECCQKTPYMFVECYRALLMHDLTDEARRLLENVN
ncbi:unnamed protein product [Gongylonema pulchrum]|uniref:Uncharacterized protein n=1 Tax=Gongylonema pulchrum TaxID=637853 RepID=A0A183E0P5_9BILA|nr:unnamed protein product [Gongylonema pulchrum]